MKKIITIIITSLVLCAVTLCQVIVEKKYYKKISDTTEVSEKKGRIVELTINNPDSTVQYELREIKKNKLLRLKKYKNGKPYSKWIFNLNEDNYFELLYAESEYDGWPEYDIREKMLKGVVEGEFEEPVFPECENNFLIYVAMNLKYPFVAVEKGLQGKVITQFIINETGEITDLSILSSAGMELDKEAIRVISNAPKWLPAKINGKPTKVHVKMPTIFILK